MVMQSLHLVSSMVLTILSKEVSLCQVNYPPNLTQNRSRICPFSYFYFIALLEEALIGFYEVETKVMNVISMTPNQFLSGASIAVNLNPYLFFLLLSLPLFSVLFFFFSFFPQWMSIIGLFLRCPDSI